MAVRASDRVTLAVLPSPSYVRLYYLLQASNLAAPAKPTANPPAAPWTVTEPNYTAGSTQTLYTVMVTAYGSVSYEYGDVQKSSAYEAAKQAYNLAASAATTVTGKNAKRVGQTEPVAPPGGWTNGDEWMVTNATDEWVGLKVWNGAAFVDYKMAAASVIIPGSVGAILLENGAIDGMVITGATVRTAATGQRVQLDVNGLRTIGPTGVETSRLHASGDGFDLMGSMRAHRTGANTNAFISDDAIVSSYYVPGAGPGFQSGARSFLGGSLLMSGYWANWAEMVGDSAADSAVEIEATSAFSRVTLRRDVGAAEPKAELTVTTDGFSVAATTDITLTAGANGKIRMLSPVLASSLGNLDGGVSAPYSMAAGVTAIPASEATITLPAGRFTVPPVVMATKPGASPVGVAAVSDGINAPTTSSFKVRIFASNGGAIAGGVVNWTAIQMTAGSAVG